MAGRIRQEYPHRHRADHHPVPQDHASDMEQIPSRHQNPGYHSCRTVDDGPRCGVLCPLYRARQKTQRGWQGIQFRSRQAARKRTQHHNISETGNRWVGKEVVSCEVPEYNKANLAICRDTLVEAVAETSEEFMERYFGGESFTENEIRLI